MTSSFAMRDDPTLRPPLPKQQTPPPPGRNTDSEPTARRSSQDQAMPSQPHKASRSRTTSHTNNRPPPILHQQTPIQDAVSNAVDQSPSTGQLDSDLMKKLTEQVTEQVIKHFQATSLRFGGSSMYSFSSKSTTQDGEPSPTSTDLFTWQSTPDSPQQIMSQSRDRVRDSVVSDRSLSEDLTAMSSQNQHRSRSGTQETQESSSDWSRKSRKDSGFDLRRTHTAGSQLYPDNDIRPTRRTASIPDDATNNIKRKDSRGPEMVEINNNTSTARSRQSPTVQAEPVDEVTTLEKIWRPLFDNGNPLPRLSQFLRGLAKHLTDDFDPQHSLVITPSKMQRFFTETRVDNEIYPWSTIFGPKMTSASLGSMYRKLRCQYHLVQDKSHDHPSIPALTPTGFETLLVCLIQAHPDIEFARLQKAVMNMPISNADDKSERFPKDISRRLLPKYGNVQAEQRLISSLDHEPALVGLTRRMSVIPPPPPQPTTAAPAGPRRQNSSSENPKRATVEDDIEDEDEGTPPSPPAVQIERERKPYYAKEGTGKKYDPEGLDRDRPRDRERDAGRGQKYNSSSNSNSNGPPPPPPARPSRNNSAVNGTPLSSSYTNNNNSNGNPTSHRMSTSQAGGVQASIPNSRRERDRGRHPSDFNEDSTPRAGYGPRRVSERNVYTTNNGNNNSASASFNNSRGGAVDDDRNDRERERERGWPIPPRSSAPSSGPGPGPGFAPGSGTSKNNNYTDRGGMNGPGSWGNNSNGRGERERGGYSQQPPPMMQQMH